jgi:hypothetical protein
MGIAVEGIPPSVLISCIGGLHAGTRRSCMADSDGTHKNEESKSGTARKKSKLIREGAPAMKEKAEVNGMDTDT